ncbi:MAG TPA: hypothetical protein VHX66_05355 [Solirubrobacteraceae bacterium]|jgi:hypothetical protein|nr:hypothetical protein [Solirubrobacteraceae bacterium]
MPPVMRMRMLTTTGLRVLNVLADSQASSLIGGHWNALKVFRDTGEHSLLAGFRNVSIGVQTPNGFRPLATFEADLNMIRSWARSGDLDIDDPYEELDGGR